MKKKKLFIAITLSNYLIDRTGTPKVVMSHQVAANDAGIKYVALFPIAVLLNLQRGFSATHSV